MQDARKGTFYFRFNFKLSSSLRLCAFALKIPRDEFLSETNQRKISRRAKRR